MLFEETKIGMRVGLCRAAFLKNGWNIDEYNYFASKISSGKIIARNINVRDIKVGNLEIAYWFYPECFVKDE